ncbi:MAG: helix-turn-helix transcriptional regulator [Candidatus Eremiobacteraeota bacterium]|nr:helix-turn-helix transcriptional regulator [Candidatus Eremiobacteraeota bacterium]
MAALLEARCWRIEGNFEACQVAANRAATEHPDAAGRIEGIALRGLAFKFINKPALAAKDFEAVRRSLARDPAATLGWPVYFMALEAWLRADYAVAEEYIRKNLDAEADVPTSLVLLGWIEVKAEHYARAGTFFMEALERHRATGTIDLRLQGTVIHAVSVVAEETVDLKLARRLEAHVAEMAWPETSLRVERFNYLVNASYIALLEGKLDLAFLRAREAVVRAPNAAYEAIGEVTIAAVCRAIGDDVAGLMQLRRAWALLRENRWGAADDEQRVALTGFAFFAASDMPAEARKAMTLYHSLTAKANTRNSLHRDRRVTAFELMAAGRIAVALGNTERARRAFEKALQIWQALQYDMRAAIVALELRRLTRKSAYEAPVRAVLVRAPSAWLGAQLAPAEGPLAFVSPAERLVLAGLLEGKSAKAIASTLDRSVNTINNHTRRIFKAFGVNSRAAVLARCATLAITPKSLERSA